MASDRIQRRTETQAIIDDLHVRDSFDTLAVRAAAEIKRLAAELTTLREREAAAVPSGWRAFDPAIMQDLGWYIVEFADNSVGMDVWEAEDGWQEIDPDSTVGRVYLMPLPGAPEPQD